MRTELISAFTDRYGRPPALVVRAPGRVNLIGEHTDYSLLPVLPFAIDRSVVVAGSTGRHHEVAADSLALPSPLLMRGTPDMDGLVGWHRYLAASVAAAGEAIEGAQLLIGGDLPFEGGLSSSSALTVATLATLSALWDLDLEEDRLIQGAAAAERATGVEGGLMDQTVIVRASEGAALRIDFSPLRTRPVPIPDGWPLIVAYSGRPALKGNQAMGAYNRLVVACRAAAALLGQRAGVDPGRPASLDAVAPVPGIMELAAHLPQEGTAETAAQEAGISSDSLAGLTLGEFDPTALLPIRAAATHALAESARVDLAENALLENDLVGFGRLLDQSQASLARLGVSTVELDELVDSMRRAGAVGSRLTGAGFGGFALAACSPEREPDVLAAALSACGGPAFAVRPAGGLTIEFEVPGAAQPGT